MAKEQKSGFTIPITPLIKALEDALVNHQEVLDASKKADEDHIKALKEYNKKVEALLPKNKTPDLISFRVLDKDKKGRVILQAIYEVDITIVEPKYEGPSYKAIRQSQEAIFRIKRILPTLNLTTDASISSDELCSILECIYVHTEEEDD